MMYVPLMNEIMSVKLLIFMFGYIAATSLIVSIICMVLDYIDNKKG